MKNLVALAIALQKTWLVNGFLGASIVSYLAENPLSVENLSCAFCPKPLHSVMMLYFHFTRICLCVIRNLFLLLQSAYLVCITLQYRRSDFLFHALASFYRQQQQIDACVWINCILQASMHACDCDLNAWKLRALSNASNLPRPETCHCRPQSFTPYCIQVLLIYLLVYTREPGGLIACMCKVICANVIPFSHISVCQRLYICMHVCM